ncbi:two-component sensor histidine kinase [Rhodobacteraceae bacterium]|nr:two-component sensor histidine kinase [Paracoccaceae bacterium]
MRQPYSMTLRIALLIGACVTVLWLLAAALTAGLLSREMDKVFDRELRENAHRILPFAVREQRIRNGDWRRKPPEDRTFPQDAPDDPRAAPLGPPTGFNGRDDRPSSEDRAIARLDDRRNTVDFVVYDASGALLLRSDDAENIDFPENGERGFSQNSDYRFYNERSPRIGMSITVAEPRDHRRTIQRSMMLVLALPLLIVIPLSLAAIFLVVRRSMAPVTRLRRALAARGPQKLEPLPRAGMSRELVPIANGVNALLARLQAAFDSERNFASNAAHEMRTPVAGAIAQAQRLQSETHDPQAATRAAAIEAGLKRLSRLSEKLMQMARAEGARLRTDTRTDLRVVLQMVLDDERRARDTPDCIHVNLPDAPMPCDLDPDAFGILARNLIENARRHGTAGHPVDISLTETGILIVRNDCPPIPPATLARLGDRFARGDGAGDGTGLGLAIVHVIAERAGSTLQLQSPIPGRDDGFEVRFHCHETPQ